MPVLVLVGIVLLSFNLRGPLVAVSTVTGDLKTELGMSGTAVGLLTSLPVLCFGLAAPLASGVIARTGVERAVLSVPGLLVAHDVQRTTTRQGVSRTISRSR
jgi:MFS transporter, CP family, cyanate transporter